LPDHTRLSIPEELFNTLSKQYGKEKTRVIASIYNEKPSTFLRVNRLVETRDNVLKNLSARGITAEPASTSDIGIKISRTPKLLTVPDLLEHACEIQDESCQIVGRQVDSGGLILDYCAGSGGKSLVFAPDMNGKGHLYLHDINQRYLQQARSKLRSAKIRNFTIFPNNVDPRLKKKMDWIIVDPPSTGSGQFRRYPDRKWLFTDGFLNACILQQRKIFNDALKYLKKDGKIMYTVSSIIGAETWGQVEFFCHHHGLYLSYEPVHSLPVSHGMDGFFCATLERK
jgi:16S rRNA C967 or C1407 C5-methylase (RsmB/RsmF family)